MPKRKYKPRRTRYRPVLMPEDIVDILRLHNEHSDIIHLIAAKIEDYGFYLSTEHLELLRQADWRAYQIEVKMKKK